MSENVVKLKKWEDPEYKREYFRNYHANRMASDSKYRQSKREAARWSRRRVKYGITQEQFEGMVILQRGRCAICSDHYGQDLRVDHNHQTGEIRGLLCANCNSGIGLLQESPKLFDAAKRYLKRKR